MKTLWAWKINTSDIPCYESGFATKQEAIADAYKWFNYYCEFETERDVILQQYRIHDDEPVILSEEDCTLYGDDCDEDDFKTHMRFECRQGNFV